MKAVNKVKVEAFEDTLEEEVFPNEGRVDINLITDAKHPLKDKFFKLGLESNYSQMLEFLNKRRKQTPNYLFVDPSFPASARILVKNDTMHQITWKRPHEMTPDAKLFAVSIIKSETIQGEVGDGYFLGPCSAVSCHPKLIKNIVPPGQTVSPEDPEYNGLLKFRFWRFGKWVEVAVDDLLPTKNGVTPLYARTDRPDEFWLSLLEKAYAKLHGSYEAMNGGFTANSLVDLTGGVVFQHELSKYDSKLADQDMFQRILRAVRRKSFVCFGIEPNFMAVTHELTGKKGKKVVTGMHIGEIYAITGACRVRLINGKNEQLIRVRNPWDVSVKWKELWGERLNLWKMLSKRKMDRLRRRITSDEEWWMTYKDLASHFHHLSISILGPDSDPDGKPYKGRWLRKSIHGTWLAGCNAGGCLNNIEKYSTNPQYRLKINESDLSRSSVDLTRQGFGQSIFQIGLMQEHRKSDEYRELPLVGIGLRIYKLRRRVGRKLPEKFLSDPSNVVLQTKAYRKQREVSLFGRLNPGYYVIVPSTFYPDSVTSYLMRIFTESEIQIDELP